MVESQIKMRRDVEVQTRRQVIVDATRRLVAERGIEAASMDEIAAAVQYTRRTLYAYFKSRDEILLQVFSEDLADRWAVQQVAVTEVETGLAKIVAWGESLFGYAREHPSSVRLQAYWSFKGIDRAKINDALFADFESLNDELTEGLRAIFRLGVADGTLRPDLKIDLSISQFVYGLRTAIDRALSPGYSFARFDAAEYVEYFLDLFTRGVRRQKESA